MPDSLLTQIERRLVALRLPLSRRQRALQELSEHREDLITAALEDGLSETEAAIRADNSLGDPTELADQIVLAARQASWWGRHPFVSFCIMPFFGVVLAIVLAYAVVLGAFYFFIPAPRITLNCAALDTVLRIYYAQIDMCEHIAQLIVIAAASLAFCKLALQSASKRHWLWVACIICSVQGYLWMMTVQAHNITVGYLLWPTKLIPVTSAIIPIAVAVFMELRERRLLRNKTLLAAVMALMPLIGSGCATHKTKKPEQPPHTRAWIGGEYNVIKKASRGPEMLAPRVNFSTNYPKALSQRKAVHVVALATNSPAYVAGLRTNDFITELNGQPVKTLRQFRNVLDTLPAESSVHLKVVRDNQSLDLTVEAGTEKFYHHGTFVITAPSFVEGWDLWPDPGFSLVFVGFEPNNRIRRDLNTTNELNVEKWRTWCGIFEVSSSDQIVGQEKRAH